MRQSCIGARPDIEFYRQGVAAQRAKHPSPVSGSLVITTKCYSTSVR